jgi:hypothetical protein
MTAPRDPDDLASALLDGLLTDDEAASARRDPAVAARLAELAGVREVVGRPPAGPDPAARERGLSAALAAYDAADDDAEPSDAEPVGGAAGPAARGRAAARPATSRADTPWRAHGSARRRWLTAAAVMLVVVGLGALASNWDTGGDDADTATQGGATEVSSNDGGVPDAAADDGGGATEETAAPGDDLSAIVDLGDVDSSEALADRARSILAQRPTGPPAAASGDEAEEGQRAGGDADFLPSACGADAESELLPAAPGRVVLQGRATVDGEPVDVWVLDADGEERLVAVDASCAVVVDQPLQN